MTAAGCAVPLACLPDRGAWDASRDARVVVVGANHIRCDVRRSVRSRLLHALGRRQNTLGLCMGVSAAGCVDRHRCAFHSVRPEGLWLLGGCSKGGRALYPECGWRRLVLDVSLLRHARCELSVGCDDVGARWRIRRNADGLRRRRVPHYQRGKHANTSASFVPNCSPASCLSSPNHTRGALSSHRLYWGAMCFLH